MLHTDLRKRDSRLVQLVFRITEKLLVEWKRKFCHSVLDMKLCIGNMTCLGKHDSRGTRLKYFSGLCVPIWWNDEWAYLFSWISAGSRILDSLHDSNCGQRNHHSLLCCRACRQGFKARTSLHCTWNQPMRNKDAFSHCFSTEKNLVSVLKAAKDRLISLVCNMSQTPCLHQHFVSLN
jgi:hypothetical protein